jgi:proteasome lid subunit RPN8/RPN11
VRNSVQIRPDVSADLIERARREPKQECCGLLAGRAGVITRTFPAKNIAPNPATSYEIAPEETVRFMREFRAAGLEFLGIYHSHPNGENAPSARDIELAYYSEEAYFILSSRPDGAKPVRAFSIREGRVTELQIEIL